MLLLVKEGETHGLLQTIKWMDELKYTQFLNHKYTQLKLMVYYKLRLKPMGPKIYLNI